MLRRLLYLQPGELGRLWPFFGLYFLLFGALTLADGVALAMFVRQVGVAELPAAYAMIAVLNLFIMAGYILGAERLGGERTFQLILLGSGAVFALAWFALQRLGGDDEWVGLMFVAREIAFTLVLMHFGTFLQDYFTRAEMNRVLPVVYSGGRLGGIAGGAVLEHLAEPLGLIHLALVFSGLMIVCALLVRLLCRRVPHVHAPEDDRGDPGVTPHRPDADLELEARASFRAFLHYVWASPLLFWTTITNFLFIVCRWVLNYQYSTFFGSYFADEVELAQFLGRYTQIALIVSLVLQTVVVNRLVSWIGLRGVHLAYSLLVVVGVAMNLWEMTLVMAVFARLVETELRFGLRNPITILITNKFSKALRTRVRAWTMGALTPLATLAASSLLGGLRRGAAGSIPWVGAAMGVVYLAGAIGLFRALAARTDAGASGENIPTSERD